MNKIFLVALSTCLFFLVSCEQKKPMETKVEESNSVDTTKTPMVAEAPKPQLTGKALLVAKLWIASDFETSTVKLAGDLINLKYNFKADSTFECQDDGNNESGKWSINEEGTKLKLIYNTAREAEYDIKQLTENSMVLAGKEHKLFRTITLVPDKK